MIPVERRDAPLILSMPHVGRDIPDPLKPRYSDRALQVEDTDWWIDRLYDFAAALGATIVRTSVSRYVIDANRDPTGASLYPGQTTSELCPTTSFDGAPLYRDGKNPGAVEIAERKRLYHAPYHDALGAEIARLRRSHGRIVLYDCHSIRGTIPRLFPGRLPVFNIGSNGGAACDPQVERIVAQVCSAASVEGYSHVVNGRFKGGWITRYYGAPRSGVHAVQMELAQRAYLKDEAPPWDYAEDKALLLRPVLTDVLSRLIDWAGARPGSPGRRLT